MPQTNLLKSFITTIACPAIVGALVAYITTRIQIGQQKKHTLVEKISRNLEDTASKATHYWIEPGRDRHAETDITRILHYLAQDINLINNKKKRADANQALIAFRKTCTGGTFETENRPADEQQAKKITKTSAALRDIISHCQ